MFVTIFLCLLVTPSQGNFVSLDLGLSLSQCICWFPAGPSPSTLKTLQPDVESSEFVGDFDTVVFPQYRPLSEKAKKNYECIILEPSVHLRLSRSLMCFKRSYNIRPSVAVSWRILSKWTCKNWDGEAWIGLIWLRIGTGGWLLWMR